MTYVKNCLRCGAPNFTAFGYCNTCTQTEEMKKLAERMEKAHQPVIQTPSEPKMVVNNYHTWYDDIKTEKEFNNVAEQIRINAKAAIAERERQSKFNKFALVAGVVLFATVFGLMLVFGK